MICRRYQYIIDHLQYDINADKRLLFYLSFFYITSSSWWCIIVRKEWLLIYRYMCSVRPRKLCVDLLPCEGTTFAFAFYVRVYVVVYDGIPIPSLKHYTHTITLQRNTKSINFLFPVCCCSTYHIIHAYYHNQYHQM